MASVSGSVADKPMPEVVEGLRAMLAAIDEGRMSCSAATRNRLQGAVIALDALSDRPSNDRL